ncbi:MAG: hypothetical protein GY781_01565 [Gammaproteobacteria bacterium]|nr:hypothetical protein [Gammaproteobacteria bacterium]
MTKGIEYVFDYLPQILDREMVCQGCRDKSKCTIGYTGILDAEYSS